jgi:hypothetical protein
LGDLCGFLLQNSAKNKCSTAYACQVLKHIRKKYYNVVSEYVLPRKRLSPHNIFRSAPRTETGLLVKINWALDAEGVSFGDCIMSATSHQTYQSSLMAIKKLQEWSLLRSEGGRNSHSQGSWLLTKSRMESCKKAVCGAPEATGGGQTMIECHSLGTESW